MNDEEKLKLNTNLRDHFLYYIKNLKGTKNVVSRGEVETR